MALEVGRGMWHSRWSRLLVEYTGQQYSSGPLEVGVTVTLTRAELLGGVSVDLASSHVAPRSIRPWNVILDSSEWDVVVVSTWHGADTGTVSQVHMLLRTHHIMVIAMYTVHL